MIKKRSIYEIFKKYDKNEVDRAIKSLPDSDKELLRLRYGEDLENPDFSVNPTVEQNKKFNTLLLPKLKRRLQNDNLIIRKTYWLDNMSVYEYFKDYTAEEVDAMMSKLKGIDKQLLELKCNSKLKEKLMTREERQFFSRTTIPRMERLLKEPNKKQQYNLSKFQRYSIYEYFSEYSKEHIDAAINKLSVREQTVINIKFSGNNDALVIKNINLYYSILKKLNKILETPDCSYVSKRGKKIKNIYDYLNDYSKEQIDEVISMLSGEEKELLYLRYGYNLEEPVFNSNWTAEQHKTFYKGLIPKMKRMLNNNGLPKARGPKSIYEHFKEYSKEEIDNMLTNLNSGEKRLITLKYGDDLENPVTSTEMTKKEKAHLQYLMGNKMRYLLEKNDAYCQKYRTKNGGIYSYFFEYSKEQINYAISTLNSEERKTLQKCFGRDLDLFADAVQPYEYEPVFQEIIKILKLQKPANNVSSRRVTNIYNYFSNYTKEQVDNMLAQLTINEKYLLRLKYGDDLEHASTSLLMTKSEKNQFRYLQTVKMENKLREIAKTSPKQEDKLKCTVQEQSCLKNSYSFVEILQELKKIFHTQEFFALLEIFSPEEAVVLSLAFGFIHGICFSVEEISDILGLDKEKVLITLKRALDNYQDDIAKIFNIKPKQLLKK